MLPFYFSSSSSFFLGHISSLFFSCFCVEIKGRKFLDFKRTRGDRLLGHINARHSISSIIAKHGWGKMLDNDLSTPDFAGIERKDYRHRKRTTAVNPPPYFQIFLHFCFFIRGVNKGGGAGLVIALPYFDRIEGATRQCTLLVLIDFCPV